MPAGMDRIAASGVADNITDAWRAVAPPLSARPNGRVLIAGGDGPGSIGLMSAGLAAALGAGEIVYLDWDEGRRTIAERDFQARAFDTTQGLPEDDIDGEFDVLVDACGNPEALRLLLRRAGAGGFVTSTAGAGHPVPRPRHTG
jgi:alcohol dehydrogenase